MNIIGTQYTLSRKAYEIYVAGCAGNPHCEGCHTPETWDFGAGTPYKDELGAIWRDMADFAPLIDRIMIFGGEPLDQDIEELEALLSWLREAFHKEIWLFTRFSLSEATNIFPRLTELCDYIKCGAYVPALSVDDNIQHGIKLATANQNIYKRGLDY